MCEGDGMANATIIERVGLTYSMRTSRLGRLLRLIALAPYQSPRSDGWERWQVSAADETTADAQRTVDT
jgi:hypothetical protein